MCSRGLAVLAGAILSLAVGAVGCRPSPKAGAEAEGPALSKSEANALGDLLSDDAGKFAYRMPAGWKAVRIPGNHFQVAVEPEREGYRANIQASRESIPRRFDLYVQESRASLLKLQAGAMIREESDFATGAGVKGRRWIVSVLQNGERLWQAYYLIPGANDDKFVFTISGRPDQELHLAFVSDVCLKTLVVR